MLAAVVPARFKVVVAVKRFAVVTVPTSKLKVVAEVVRSPPLTAKSPTNVVLPVTPKVPAKLTAPVTFKVDDIETAPVASKSPFILNPVKSSVVVFVVDPARPSLRTFAELRPCNQTSFKSSFKSEAENKRFLVANPTG